MTLTEFENARSRRSENTARCYGSAAKQFAKSLNLSSPEQIVEEVKGGRLDPITALDKFVGDLTARQLAPKSVGLYVSAVLSFLRFHQVKVDRDELKNRLILPPQVEISTDRAFTDTEVRSLLLRGNLKSKTLLEILLVTGGRIGEVSKLKVGNFDFDSNPPRVTFAALMSKGKRARTLFLTEECRDLIKEYLGPRIANKDSQLFPNSSAEGNIQQLKRLIIKGGMRSKILAESRRYQVHAHSCRKFFYSKCLSCGVIPNLADAWLGHKVGLDANYLRLSEESQIAEFAKVAPSLTFLSTVTDPQTQRESDERLKSLELENIRLMKDSVDASKRVGTQEDEIKRLRQALEDNAIVFKNALAQQVKKQEEEFAKFKRLIPQLMRLSKEKKRKYCSKK